MYLLSFPVGVTLIAYSIELRPRAPETISSIWWYLLYVDSTEFEVNEQYRI